MHAPLDKGLNSNVTARKIRCGEEVERVFPLYSPLIAESAVARRSDVRRASCVICAAVGRANARRRRGDNQRAAGVEVTAGRSRRASVVRTAALPTGGDADQPGHGGAHKAQRAGFGHNVGDQFERDVADRCRVARRVAANPVQREDLVEQSELRRVECSQEAAKLTAGRQQSERVEAGEREAAAREGIGAGQVVGRGSGRVGHGKVGGFRR